MRDDQLATVNDLAVKDVCWIDYDGSRDPYLCGLVRDHARRSLKTVTVDKKFSSEEEAIIWSDTVGLKVLGVGDFLDKYAKYYAHHMQWDG